MLFAGLGQEARTSCPGWSASRQTAAASSSSCRQPSLLPASRYPARIRGGATRRRRVPRLIATTSGRAGLRISLLGGEHTLFSRVVRGAAAPITDPQSLGAEIERTRDYLVSQRRIASDAPLTRIVDDLPADAGTEHHSLPPVRVAAAGALPEGELPGGHDAHLLLSLRRAPTTIGWPLVPGATLARPPRKAAVRRARPPGSDRAGRRSLAGSPGSGSSRGRRRSRTSPYRTCCRGRRRGGGTRRTGSRTRRTRSPEHGVAAPPQESTPEPATPTCPRNPRPACAHRQAYRRHPAPPPRRRDPAVDGRRLAVRTQPRPAPGRGHRGRGVAPGRAHPPASGDHWPIGEVFLPGAQPLRNPRAAIQPRLPSEASAECSHERSGTTC